MTINEATPLTGSVSSASVIDPVSGIWNTIAATENKKAVLTIIHNLQQGSIRVLAVVSAICLVFSSFFNILDHIFQFHLFAAILQCYTLVLGCILLLLEFWGRQQQQLEQYLSLMETTYELIIRWAPFLTYVWGRGALYVLAGSLHMVFGSFSDFVVGTLTISVGVIYIVVERQIYRRRPSTTVDNWRTKFEQADHDGDGKLSIDDLNVLLDALGLKLSLWELEVAFMGMDPRNSGTITMKAFQQWWSGVGEGN